MAHVPRLLRCHANARGPVYLRAQVDESTWQQAQRCQGGFGTVSSLHQLGLQASMPSSCYQHLQGCVTRPCKGFTKTTAQACTSSSPSSSPWPPTWQEADQVVHLGPGTLGMQLRHIQQAPLWCGRLQQQVPHPPDSCLVTPVPAYSQHQLNTLTGWCLDESIQCFTGAQNKQISC